MRAGGAGYGGMGDGAGQAADHRAAGGRTGDGEQVCESP